MDVALSSITWTDPVRKPRSFQFTRVAWGSYTPVLADREIESPSIAADRLQSYQRVWAILLWGGFENYHQKGGPLKVALEATFEEAATHGFGEMLEVRLYKRSPRPSVDGKQQ